MKSIPFPTRTFISTRPFELVHSDVWGPSPVLSKGGYSYYVTFIDDLMIILDMYGFIFLTLNREVFTFFKEFCAKIQNQFQSHISILRSDSRRRIPIQ